jgi:hypothetical protein
VGLSTVAEYAPYKPFVLAHYNTFILVVFYAEEEVGGVGLLGSTGLLLVCQVLKP